MRALPLILPIILAGCATSPPVVQGVAVDGGCRVFRIIKYSPDDTKETVSGVIRHNAAHRSYCRRKKS